MIGERFMLEGVRVVVVREGMVKDRDTGKPVGIFLEVERDDDGVLEPVSDRGRKRVHRGRRIRKVGGNA